MTEAKFNFYERVKIAMPLTIKKRKEVYKGL